jgi:hypothetical protein
MRFFLFSFFLILTCAALADPPMKTVYNNSSTTNFTWTWPYHTNQTRTSFRDHPSPTGSFFKTSYATQEDVSQYRFHNAHLTYQNEWGYFFPSGTRPIQNNGSVFFVTPRSNFFPYLR